MCGIAGTVGIGDRALVARMTRLISHRGPDDEGLFESGDVCLGNRRLAIIDLGDGGHQPMTSADGRLAITFNGEIYNYRELRRQLEASGHRFRTASDTETILHAYQRHGIDCLSLLEGMFAFALWDERNGTLLLARDSFGIKPLFYCLRDGGIAFASELKQLCLVPGLEREINPRAVASTIRFACNLDDESIVRSIFKLRPGGYLQWRNGAASSGHYRRLPEHRPRSAGLDELCTRVRAALTDSVRSHLVADVPVGAALSGGIDSSALVAVMSHLGAPVKTFTAGHGEDDPDLVHARVVAEHFGTEHHESLLDTGDVPDLLPIVVWHLDEPVGLGSPLHMYLNYRQAAAHLKVLLVGEGADELFAGYPHHKIFDPALPLPRAVRTDLYRRGHLISDSTPRTLLGALAGALVMGRPPPNPLAAGARRMPQGVAEHGHCASLHEALRFDQSVLSHRLLRQADATGMAHSVELRVPYLDRRMVELAATIPDHYLLHRLTGKYILRRAMAPLLPERIAGRVKRSYQLRYRQDVTDAMAYLCDRLLTPAAIRRRGLFDPARIAVLRNGGPGRWAPPVAARYWGYRLWTVIGIEIWARLFIDRNPAVAAPTGLGDLL